MTKRKMPDPTHGHSIAVASRLSGVPIETLRAWERRYGFPRPARVEGTNRRLYSDEDIACLRAIRAALAQGLRAGDVVGRELSEIEALLVRAAPEAPAPASDAAASLPTVARLIALLAADEVTELETQLRRLAGALGPKAFVTDVAQPLALEVGRAWECGELDVRQEHYASEALATQLRILLGGLQDVSGGPTVLLATLPGELHTLGLVMVAVYLALSGARPRILGATTPVDELASAASALHADVVGLTITAASLGIELERQLHALEHALPRGTRLWLGGAGAAQTKPRPGREVVRDWVALDAALDRARARKKEHGGGRLGAHR